MRPSIFQLALASAVASAAASVVAVATPPDGVGVSPIDRVYPAMREGSSAYVVTVGADGKIGACDSIDDARANDPAPCSALRQIGIPAGVVPAAAQNGRRMWLKIEDIPDEMMTTDTHDSVQLLFEVDEHGRVAECRPYKSTGAPAFDSLACKMLMKRVHFTPASYNGAPVHAVGTAIASLNSY